MVGQPSALKHLANRSPLLGETSAARATGDWQASILVKVAKRSLAKDMFYCSQQRCFAGLTTVPVGRLVC